MSAILINTTAARLIKGQRVKLRHSRQMYRCIEACAEGKDGYACVAIGYHKLWLSPGYRVQVPIDDDPVLGKGVAA